MRTVSAAAVKPRLTAGPEIAFLDVPFEQERLSKFVQFSNSAGQFIKSAYEARTSIEPPH